ncbi:hypothetical protein [Streptomyces sp. NPDC088246]|uniref:hypothetical protein n=1 Tax=Streptomyces sp. NPDC088246 TaxID=3365842 RepID=UPI0037F42197
MFSIPAERVLETVLRSGYEGPAETGGDGSARYLANDGAAALAVGSAALFASVRRRAAAATRRGD